MFWLNSLGSWALVQSRAFAFADELKLASMSLKMAVSIRFPFWLQWRPLGGAKPGKAFFLLRFSVCRNLRI